MDLKCKKCGYYERICICDVISPVHVDTRVVLMMHHKEIKKFSNTGKLVPFSLSNSEIRLRGEIGKPMNVTDFEDDKYRRLFLFPSEGARVLDQDFLDEDKRPIMLVVPDGNWNQASKINNKIAKPFKFEAICLPEDGAPSNYRLRSNPHHERISTFEAVSRAMGILENKELEEKMNELFNTAIDRLLYFRGKLKPDEVYGGLPSN